MKPNDSRQAATRDQDLLEKYVSSIESLYLKFGRIADNQQALADSLNRVVTALRSIGTARKQEPLVPRRLAAEP